MTEKVVALGLGAKFTTLGVIAEKAMLSPALSAIWNVSVVPIPPLTILIPKLVTGWGNVIVIALL